APAMHWPTHGRPRSQSLHGPFDRNPGSGAVLKKPAARRPLTKVRWGQRRPVVRSARPVLLNRAATRRLARNSLVPPEEQPSLEESCMLGPVLSLVRVALTG